MFYTDTENYAILERLTNAFGSKLNIAGVVVPTSSGRTALELALRVLKKNYPARRNVVIPTYCCRGVFDPIAKVDLVPVFADMDDNLNMSVDSFGRCASRDTLAVVVAHIGGCGAQIERIVSIAKDYDIVVIEDACQSLGRKSSGNLSGTQHDMSIFSLGLGKNLMATAGGFLVSNILKADVSEEANRLGEEKTSVVRARFIGVVLKHFLNLGGDLDQYLFSSYEYSKMHALDAALALSQLDRLDPIIQRRRKNAKAIGDVVCRVNLNTRLQQDKEHIYTKLSLIFESLKECNRLRSALDRAGIETESMYVPLHLRRLTPSCSIEESLPHSERMYRNVFNVPVRPNLSEGELHRIIRAIESAGRR